jgi:hypothetical protein
MHRFDVLTEHFQVILMDPTSEDDFSKIWTEHALQLMLAVGERAIAVGTLRQTTVRLDVAVSHERPSVNLSEADHAAEGSIALPSGTLVVMDCTARRYEPTIAVAPGNYALLFLVSGVATIRDESTEADDCYRVFLWPAERCASRLIKHWRADG